MHKLNPMKLKPGQESDWAINKIQRNKTLDHQNATYSGCSVPEGFLSTRDASLSFCPLANEDLNINTIPSLTHLTTLRAHVGSVSTVFSSFTCQHRNMAQWKPLSNTSVTICNRPLLLCSVYVWTIGAYSTAQLDF